jgi:hypothetical protein
MTIKDIILNIPRLRDWSINIINVEMVIHIIQIILPW